MRHPNSKPISRNRIVFLDYLRIVAFTSVLIGHKFYTYLVTLSNDQTVHSTPRLIANLLLPFVYGGGVGVGVFFLVSGYIITHVLQTEQTREFLIKRTFRIYPLYIVAVLAQYIFLSVEGNAPGLLILLPQLLLVGDFFGTPYALNGAEWTLRVEVMFYAYMVVLRSLNLMTHYKKLLPYCLLGTAMLCWFLAPIPSAEIWSKGYFTIYGPFLLLGVIFYLYEKKQTSVTILMFSIGFIFYQHYSLMATYQQRWLDAHFAILAFIIFVVFWIFRRHITAAPWVLFLSDLTYAIYLFHNWFFGYAKQGLAIFSVSVLNPDIQALVVLLLVCFFMVKYVEKPGIRLGRTLLPKV